MTHEVAKIVTKANRFNDTLLVVKEHLEKQIAEWKQESQDTSADGSISPLDKCSFNIYMQLKPLIEGSDASEIDKRLIENEESFDIPNIEASSMVYSPECGILLQSESLEGPRVEKFENKSKNFAFILAIVAFLQLILTIKQLEYSSTQSALTRVSKTTIAMQIAIDAYMCMVTLTGSFVFPSLFSPYVVCAFLFFVAFSFYEMRYHYSISRIGNRENDEQGLYFSTIIFFFLFYQLAQRMNLIAVVLGVAMYSYWVPQIIHNVKRNSRKGFRRSYILGMTAARLVPPVYVFGCPANVINFGEAYPYVVIILLFWSALQVLILHIQEIVGPRFLIPRQFLPDTYNYFPVLHEDIENPHDEANESGGLVHITNKDCAICFLPVDTEAGPSFATEANYMVTPCHHIFHPDCLEKWMEIKLECPICRTELPPI